MQGDYHRLAMPFYPLPLSKLLNFRAFTPEDCPQFTSISHWLLSQTCQAVAYLRSQGIAHRDINPSNLLLGQDGHLVLADFSTAIRASEKDRILDVSTGTFRAPELLFTHFDYDPLALDLWCLGVTCAHLFTPLVQDAVEDSDEDDDGAKPAWMAGFKKTTEATYSRETLFSEEHGEIGLLGSIFRVIGTPTSESWPVRNPSPHRCP
jgi:serine/threonine protein kinase